MPAGASVSPFPKAALSAKTVCRARAEPEASSRDWQESRGIRGRLAYMLGKARAEDEELETVRQKEREQDLDEERRRQRELDRDLGWEL